MEEHARDLPVRYGEEEGGNRLPVAHEDEGGLAVELAGPNARPLSRAVAVTKAATRAAPSSGAET